MRLLPTIVRTAPRLLLAAVLPVTAAARADAPPPVNPADAAADADLADRFEALAELAFPAKMPTAAERPFVFGQQAALLRAAATLAADAVPPDPRYDRKLAEALSYVGDVDGQNAALLAVLRQQPGDEFTWVRLLESHLAAYQTADKQVAYLKGIEAAPNVPRAVLAHAGARRAQILVGQGRDNDARQLLTSVLLNDPLNGDALRLQVRLLPDDATPFLRLQALLAVLRANPLQPAYARLVARLAADAGLVQDALPFYTLSVNTAGIRRPADYATALEWAAEQYVAGQNVDAYQFVQTLLGIRPEDSATWYLDLLIVRSSGLPIPRQDQELQRATVVMSNRVANAVNAVLDADAPTPRPAPGTAAPTAAPTAATRPTTRPLDTEGSFPFPDLGPAVAAIRRSDGAADGPTIAPAVRQPFVEAVADLARLEIYFAHKPELATPLLDALRAVLPQSDPLLAQLQGLQDLFAGLAATPPDKARLDRAQTELAGVGATDPLAGVGLTLLLPRGTPAEQQQADRAARKRLQDHAAGLVGAFVAEALRSPAVQLVPNPQQAGPLDNQLQAFPRELFGVGVQPQGVYSIHVEPVNVGRALGEPLLARITLFNISPVDLTIGDDGVIRPGMLFQMTPKVAQTTTAYPAFDTLAGPLVLHPREPLSQVVRVDQAALLHVLQDNVRLQFEVDGQAATNAEVGLAGYSQKFTKPFVRTAASGTAVADARGQLNGAGAANASTPHGRMTALGVVEAYVREMRAQRNVPPGVALDVANLANDVHRARNDPSPAVAAWAAHADLELAPAASRPAMVDQMAADPNWRVRQLTLAWAGSAGDPAVSRRLADQLRDDPQDSVREYARAALGMAKLGLPPTPPAAPPVPRP